MSSALPCQLCSVRCSHSEADLPRIGWPQRHSVESASMFCRGLVSIRLPGGSHPTRATCEYSTLITLVRSLGQLPNLLDVASRRRQICPLWRQTWRRKSLPLDLISTVSSTRRAH